MYRDSVEKYRNVCDIIVPKELCVGCGVCAGICPTGALKIQWNDYGEYIPVEQPGKCTECEYCLKVCPFWNQKENETELAKRKFKHQEGVRYNPVLGLFIGLFSGYSKVDNLRIQGASGGLTTWLLEKLLTQKIVDRVCSVLPNNDPDKLFCYSVLDSIQDIRKASRSVYYPVELSKIISDILNSDKKYAIVGLPCFLKSIRLAMLVNPELRKRIIVLLGLVCGQQKSKFFAEYLCVLAGGDPAILTSVTFRAKDLGRDSLDHRFQFICKSNNGARAGYIYNSEGMGWLWGHDCFKLNACNFCDDIAAEVADISFGDAISEPYSYGNEGSNFVILRSRLMYDLLLDGASKAEILLERAPLKAVLERQQCVAILKRDDLRHRLYTILQKGKISYIPLKRFLPHQRLDAFSNWDMEIRDKIRTVSRNTYAQYRYQQNIVFHVERAIASVFERAAYNNWQLLGLPLVAFIYESIKYMMRKLVRKLHIHI